MDARDDFQGSLPYLDQLHQVTQAHKERAVSARKYAS
jgi:hypothetical protein